MMPPRHGYGAQKDHGKHATRLALDERGWVCLP
jgi:hypothetical protein